MPPPAHKPVVLLLSINKEPYWDDQYSTLVDLLASKATVKRVINADSAVRFVTKNTPSAIFVTDAALTKNDPELDKIQMTVVEYVLNGGVAVIATHFSSFVLPTDIGRWFSTSWKLPWESGDHYRTTVHLNSTACRDRFAEADLPEQHSQKAIFLKNIGRHAAIYMPTDQSQTESHVFSLATVDSQQTLVAYTNIGSGWLGYVGNVNGETESNKVISAMCGL